MFIKNVHAKYQVQIDLSKEADAFDRGMRLDEVPKEYRGMRLIGRGNTSIILEKDPETVVMLTRDDMKKDWLHYGLQISTDWKIHDIRAKKSKFQDLHVFAIEMPKLYQLDPKNKKKVQEDLKFFNKMLSALGIGEHIAKWSLPRIAKYYEDQHKTDSIIYHLVNFLHNYDPDQWIWDLAKRQFAQDKKGNIVLVDPIASSKLVKMMHFEKNPLENEIKDMDERFNFYNRPTDRKKRA